MPALRLKLTRQLLGRLREERVPLEVVRGLARRCFRDCESVRHRGRTHHPRILIFELSVDDGATTCERSRLIPRGSCQRRRHDESSGAMVRASCMAASASASGPNRRKPPCGMRSPRGILSGIGPQISLARRPDATEVARFPVGKDREDTGSVNQARRLIAPKR